MLKILYWRSQIINKCSQQQIVILRKKYNFLLKIFNQIFLCRPEMSTVVRQSSFNMGLRDTISFQKKRKALNCSGVDQSWEQHQPQEHSREHSSEFGKNVICSIIDQHIRLCGPGTIIPRWRLSSKKTELWTTTGLPIP